MAAKEHLEQARQKISDWERAGGLGGRSFRETMLMIRADLATLKQVSTAHPELANEARILEERYSRYALRITFA